MLIIFESPDKTGKTTIAKELSKFLKIPYIKLKNISIEDNEGIDNSSVSVATHSQLETFVQLYEKGVIKDAIIDRFHASEAVYSKLFKRSYDSSYIGELENRLAERNDVILVHLTTPNRILKKRWKEEEKLVDESHINGLVAEYKRFYSNTKLDYIEIETGSSIDTTMANIMQQLYIRGVSDLKFKNRRATHEEAMMGVAHEMAKRSPDLGRQVGAVLTENGFIIGAGYNGPPSGLSHDKTCPRRERGYKSGEKLELSRAVHAEQNAIMQSGIRGTRSSSGKLELFSTTSPCVHCMRMLIQIGVQKIYYSDLYNDEMALIMAKEANIEMIHYEN